jgi:hypothetical protein
LRDAIVRGATRRDLACLPVAAARRGKVATLNQNKVQHRNSAQRYFKNFISLSESRGAVAFTRMVWRSLHTLDALDKPRQAVPAALRESLACSLAPPRPTLVLRIRFCLLLPRTRVTDV